MNSKAGSAALSRRGFVQAGGALLVTLAFPRARAAGIDASRVASWLEVHDDNTILVRTGRGEIGTGMSAFYPQTVAEELRVRPQAITLIMADTDRTPDGGFSSGFLTGAANLRKVAAHTYQALLELAAGHLGVPAASLTVSDGIVSGGGKSVAYGQLVQGQQLELTIPISGKLASMDASVAWGVADLGGLTVTGNPPLKAVAQYTVVGTSHPMPGIPNMVTGRTQWSCDVSLPGMLHARMVRPATPGSQLISIGALDKKRFPQAAILRKGNLIGVVSPDEWEAVSAARSVAASTKWTEWAGLPGSENSTQAIRECPWSGHGSERGHAADVDAALAGAHRTIAATFEQPYVKHAPIGPFVAVADVRRDGTITVWSHSSQSQGLRVRIANMMGVAVEKVVVRWLEHAGQYGRTTYGGDGAEADAVILSRLAGKPVRVQWTLQEDLAWSTTVPAWVADIRGALDSGGRLTAVRSAMYSPHMFDARPLGAILAGMPCGTVTPGSWVSTIWPYDRIQARYEQAFGMPNLGAAGAWGGLRGNIMRTPGQRQQNFVLEGLINEAAAATGADPVQYRIDHTTDRRLIDILQATAKAASWEPRPSPHPGARRSGGDPVQGRGVSIIVRDNAYWVGIAEVAVNPASGAVQALKFTIGVECGKVINPRHLDRCMRSGVVMGLSEALKEELTFDKSQVRSTDWSRYKILTMEETPEIRVVQISRDDKGFGTGGEAANAVGPAAVAAAVFDATGVKPRRLPLTPAYVSQLLRV